MKHQNNKKQKLDTAKKLDNNKKPMPYRVSDKQQKTFSEQQSIQLPQQKLSLKLGQQQYESNNCKEAKIHFRKAIELNPKQQLAYYYLCEILLQQKRSEAITLSRQLIAFCPDKWRPYSYLAKLLITIRQRYDEAIECLRKVVQLNPTSVEAYIKLGRIVALDTGSVEEGLVWNCRARKMKPFDPEVNLHLGIMHSKLRRYSSAIDYFEKAIVFSKEKTNIKVDIRDQSYFELGMANLQLRRYFIAELNLRKAIQLKPCSNYYFSLGIIYQREKKLDKARSFYFEALKMQPGHSSAYHRLALIGQKKNNLYEAIRYYQKTIESNPKNSCAFHSLSKLHRKNGAYLKARACFQKAIQLSLQKSQGFLAKNHQMRHLKYYQNLSFQRREEIRYLYEDSVMHLSTGKSLFDANKIDQGFHCFDLAIEESEKIRKMFKAIEYWSQRYLDEQQTATFQQK